MAPFILSALSIKTSNLFLSITSIFIIFSLSANFAEKIRERILEENIKDEVKPETDEETQIADASDEEEQEIPVNQLREVSPSVIECLLKNGFETLAELSITEKEELVEIEGIDLETAKVIIAQAKKQLANDK